MSVIRFKFIISFSSLSPTVFSKLFNEIFFPLQNNQNKGVPQLLSEMLGKFNRHLDQLSFPIVIL